MYEQSIPSTNNTTYNMRTIIVNIPEHKKQKGKKMIFKTKICTNLYVSHSAVFCWVCGRHWLFSAGYEPYDDVIWWVGEPLLSNAE